MGTRAFLPRQLRIRDFFTDLFYPRNFLYAAREVPGVRITAIIPTYKPPHCIISLVQRLLRDPLVAEVVIVDDASPHGSEEIFQELETLERGTMQMKIKIIHLKENLHRAGAVNEGLRTRSLPSGPRHDILVLDDDVVLEEGALTALARQLHVHERIGAVCTQARVANRRENLLTRLQGLEYVGFNVSRVADRGFLYGPLIMHGLASLIKSEVLIDQAKGYDRTQLLEDYDLTVRIKTLGYHVALADASFASTIVPAQWGQLWKQRVRWQYGGMHVIKSHWRMVCALLPDMLSHALTITLYTAIISSIFWHTYGIGESGLITVVRVTSLFTSIVFYFFQLYVILFLDRGRDWKDIVLRIMLVPEFVYAVILSFVLLGSYVFFLYTMMKNKLILRVATAEKVLKYSDKMFSWFGFTTTWGTK